MERVAKQVAQSALVIGIGVPILLVLIALCGWLASLIYQAFTGHPPPGI